MIWYKRQPLRFKNLCGCLFISVTECSLLINETVGTSHGFIFLVNIAEERLHCCLELSINALDNIGGMISHLDVGFELGIFLRHSLPLCGRLLPALRKAGPDSEA